MDQDKLRDILYRHATAARDIGQGMANDFVSQLNSFDEELSDLIAARYARIERDGFDKGPATTKALEEMKRAYAEVNAKAYGKAAKGLTSDLEAIASHEATFAAKAVSSAGVKVDFGATIPGPQYLKALVTTTPLPFAHDGHTLLMPWLEVQEAGRLRRLEGSLRMSAGLGESTGQAVRRIMGTKAGGYADGILQTSRKDATTIALTANNAISSAARNESYSRMKSIRYVEWSAILDSRTSQTCQKLSGTIFVKGSNHQQPPAHPRCRSLLIPRRDNEGTKHKPYGEWLREQPEAVQDDVLGKARADVFRANPDFDFAGYFKEGGGYKSIGELRQFDERLFGEGGVKSPAKPKAKPEAPKAPVAEIIDTKAIDARERAYVLDKGKATGVEHLVAYDDTTGAILERKKGKKSSVSFSQELVAALANPANRIVLHHNHPGSSSLSYQDLKVVTGQPGAKAIWAHAHNGSSFYAEPGKLALKKATVDAISNALLKALQKLINLGAVKIEDAQLLHNHLTWLAVHEVGQIKYIAELTGESKAAFDRNRVIYGQLLESLK